jgi:hypothetical protein
LTKQSKRKQNPGKTQGFVFELIGIRFYLEVLYLIHMGKRGPKLKKRISTEWSGNLAYAIGLLSSDGNLSSDQRHISFKSTDYEQVLNFRKCLKLDSIKIGVRKQEKRKDAYVVQFGSVEFYNFLLTIGLTPNKSKTISKLKVPDIFYPDFLRGEFDGDGSSHSYWDKRWKSSFLLYLNFCSASPVFIDWMQETNKKLFGISGHSTKARDKDFYQLKYAKKEAMVLFDKMYYNKSVICLKRKKSKLEKAFKINQKQQSKYK